MTVKVLQHQEIVDEASEILLAHMSRAKVALLLSTWRVGSGDYLKLREQLFGDETVATLLEKVQTYQAQRGA